uniref:FZ domain-containing protein n=1 Tax=Panagrellus redivivus TaxID=6233 RepID=A0A7E4UN44_PANRE
MIFVPTWAEVGINFVYEVRSRWSLRFNAHMSLPDCLQTQAYCSSPKNKIPLATFAEHCQNLPLVNGLCTLSHATAGGVPNKKDANTKSTTFRGPPKNHFITLPFHVVHRTPNDRLISHTSEL